MLYIKRVRIHLTRNLHEHQYSPQNGYIDGPHQFLARPPPEYVTMLSKNPPSLKINLTIEEQGVILTRLYDALSQCAFDFLATYQIPLPLDPSMRALERPSDLNWVEWVHLLKQLAMKKCILARVLCGDEINQLPAVLESSLEVGPISQPKVQRDDRNVLQMLFAGIQVAKLLRDSRAMDYLDAMYTATENIRQERSLFESRS
ncbi:hypothetical protein N431DRAFT_344497 [Stipitochalara longipes BDJ]|nr:hypothetical protein N431DRAFT_344497 [Stipitochalara longipes BDJ]